MAERRVGSGIGCTGGTETVVGGRVSGQGMVEENITRQEMRQKGVAEIVAENKK